MHVHIQRRHYHQSLHLLALLLLMTVGFFSFIQCHGQTDKQIQVGIVTALAYFCWGIYHHICSHDLNWKVVVEYAAIGFLGVAILWILLLNIY